MRKNSAPRGQWRRRLACMVLVLLVAPLTRGDDLATNAILDALVKSGIPNAAHGVGTLPLPTVGDGLDAAAQKQAIQTALGADYDFDDFTRPSPVAPVKVRVGEQTQPPADPNQPPARTLDVFFVAYGDLDTISSKDLLERLNQIDRRGGESKTLTNAALARQNIVRPAESSDREGFAQLTFPLLDRVQLSIVTHSCWSRTDDSLMVAGYVDSRFQKDPEFPNRWRPIKPGAKVPASDAPASPYDGAAYYLKVTQLAVPHNALFVEGHVAFNEPRGWFDGANLLRSKLPLVIQEFARGFRRELAKSTTTP